MEKDNQFLQPYNVTMSKHSLSAMELRVMVSLLYAIKNEQYKTTQQPDLFETREFDEIELNKADLVIGTNYNALMKSLRTLRSRTLHIKDKVTGNDIICGLISSSESKPMSNTVTVQMDKKTLPYLIKLGNNYTKSGIEFAFQTQSKYSIRWYQLACHWVKQGCFSMKPIDIRKTFRIPETAYKRTIDFSHRIIKEPLKELEKHADFYLSYTTRKQGKKIVLYDFKVHKRRRKANKNNSTSQKKSPIDPSNRQETKQEKNSSIEQTIEQHKDNFYSKKLHALIEETKYEQGAWKSVCYHFSTECEFDYYFKEMTKKLDLDKIKTIFAFKNRLSSYMTACIFNDIKAPKEKILARFNQEIKKY